MKIAYITAQTPWGQGETFILEEILKIKQQGVDLLIVPRNPSKEIFHQEANKLLENSIWLPLINFKMIICCLEALFLKISTWKILETILIQSRNPWIFIKNLAVFPKGIFVAKILKKKKVEHIHAQWGSTTSTMAYIISVLTGIPWSFTLHRWDIKENNILKEKAKSAKFIRCISKHGKKELLEIIGRDYDKKITIIHSAVKIPAKINEVSSIKQIFTIVTPANLLEVKGHKYLIDACSILINRGIKNFQCIFYGNGPMQNKLEHLIKEKKLTAYVKISGCIPHEELIKKYQNKEVNLVILPSITTNHKEHEGIPVSLMEAMAYGIPTISTNTGGIPELLSNGAGILVEEKSSKELAQSIVRLMRDKNLYRNISQNGYQRVNQEFNIEKNVKKILRLIKNSL